MIDLPTFLEQRWQEAEADALAAGAVESSKWWVDGPAEMSGKHWVYATGEKFTAREVAAHIARNDPAHVLADIASKRAVLALHPIITDPARLVAVWTGATPGSACGTCGGDPVDSSSPLEDIGPCATLGALASPYADHPDYDESWKP